MNNAKNPSICRPFIWDLTSIDDEQSNLMDPMSSREHIAQEYLDKLFNREFIHYIDAHFADRKDKLILVYTGMASQSSNIGQESAFTDGIH